MLMMSYLTNANTESERLATIVAAIEHLSTYKLAHIMCLYQ